MRAPSLAELKTHLRIEHDDEDAYLGMLLHMAKAAAENFCMITFPARKTPEPVWLAMLLHASYYYTHREAANAGAYEHMLRAFRALLWPYRDTGKLV